MTLHEQALERVAGRAAECLRAVAHPARLRIIFPLLDGEQSAGDLARRTRVCALTQSRHTASLVSRALSGRRRIAMAVRYRLGSSEAEPLADLLHRFFCETPMHRPRAGRHFTGSLP
jgi:ArsR family transcriptional regulator